jgi:hypothetical protein
MGIFNKAAPFDETRYTTIPAQPGWFVFEWEGSRTHYTMRKAPIVAWLVETEFYPETRTGSERLTGRQDFFPVAHPVTTGGVDHSDRLIALGPDSCVYQLNKWSMLARYRQLHPIRLGSAGGGGGRAAGKVVRHRFRRCK